jgi:hypothetical protein
MHVCKPDPKIFLLDPKIFLLLYAKLYAMLQLRNYAFRLALCAVAVTLSVNSSSAFEKPKVLGKDRIFAFLYLPKNTDPNTLHSANLIFSKPKEWKYWNDKGVIPCQGKTWHDLLRNPINKAVEILTSIDYGGNPEPTVCIDEFGFDFGGQTDHKTATILRMTKSRMPNLHLAVWQMRGPIAPVLSDAYKDVVDLVMIEAYVGSKEDYWSIITQVKAAQLQGLMHKTVVALGLGIGGNAGENWASTKKELEQQIRFLRLIAPESPGIAFFAAGADKGEPGLLTYADELCEKFGRLPTDGSGLPKDVIELYKTFSKKRKAPAIVVSNFWAEPDRSEEDPGKLVQPKTMHVLLMNLGEERATDVMVRLRNPEDKGGDVFAQGKVNIPGKSIAIAVLSVTAKWNVWKTWEIEVDAGKNEVLIYPQKKS